MSCVRTDDRVIALLVTPETPADAAQLVSKLPRRYAAFASLAAFSASAFAQGSGVTSEQCVQEKPSTSTSKVLGSGDVLLIRLLPQPHPPPSRA